jgi:hypothetical protein
MKFIVNCSDFLLMAHCPYISFGTLNKKLFRESVTDNIFATVWSRSMIAHCLGMTEDQVVEWGLLIGNDFTGQYKRSQYDGVDGKYDEQFATFEDLLNELKAFIMSKGDGYQLRSSFNELNQATLYSRVFYSMGDLLAFPIDDPDRFEDYMGINRIEKDYIDRYLELHEDDLSVESEMTISSMALAYLEQQENEMGTSNQIYDTCITKMYKYFDNYHIEALKYMINQSNQRAAKLSTSKNVNNSKRIGEKNKLRGRFRPLWNDVIASNQYQLLCKRILRYKRYDTKHSLTPYDEVILFSI